MGPSPRRLRPYIVAAGFVVLLHGYLLYSQAAALEALVGRRPLARYLRRPDRRPPARDPPIGNAPGATAGSHAPPLPAPSPAPPSAAASLRNASGCRPAGTAYTPEADARCVAFLGDTALILSVVPMPSIIAVARTIKFKVRYAAGHIRAIAKVSQNKFPFEPHSEYLAYVIDRLLGLNLVPPTAWVLVPVAALRLGLEAITDPTFRQWVERDVFRHPDTLRQTVLLGGLPHLPMSVQLWVSDVHPLQDSLWAVDRNWQPLFHPATPLPPHPALPSLSDLTVLDYVLTNPDRRLDKNTYVAGGCVRHCERRKGEEPHTGPITLVALDQGSAFYAKVPPAGNAMTPPDNDFCRFRASTVSRLKALQSGRPGVTPFFTALMGAVPPSVLDVVDPERLRWAQDRLDAAAAHVVECERRHGNGAVAPWP